MLDEMAKLDYKNVLRYFFELSAVPRGSYNNKGISDFLVAFAKEQGLRYIQDEALNVIIFGDATPGYEAATPVIIQGHMDMVCVTDGSDHDFTKEGLDLFVEDGDWIGAKGTTLGGDDGIALAYGMALLADRTIAHPAIEFVITTDEETGMEGATALDCSELKGRYMINCDSEDEGIVLVSCAGGMRVDAGFELRTVEAEGTCIDIEALGLKGGHSGQEIDKGRTNAILLLGRMLFGLEGDWLLVSMSGGEKDNAIPSSAKARLLVRKDEEKEVLSELEKLADMLKTELSASEPDLYFEIRANETKKAKAIHPVDSEKILFALIQGANGVQTMSQSIEGLVESSLNLGIFRADVDGVEFHYSLRSSVASYKKYMAERLQYLFEYLGGECSFHGEYPAWEYKKESKLREVFGRVFEREYGYAPKLQAIHAGLECGLICEKIPDIDIVSIGPDMKDIHTPRERLSMSSSVRVYKFLEKLLEEMKELV